MEFKKYQHIEKLGTSEVEGVLNGTVYLFYKIDGTNSQVWLKEDGTLGFGSRNREVTPSDDNAGFAKAMEGNEELLKILRNHPNYTIYGEWLVPHTLRTYGSSSWRRFYVFDVLDEDTGEYLPYEEYKELFKNSSLDVIPLLAKLENPTKDDIMAKLPLTGEYLCQSGLGEGIVIKNYSFKNKYGRTTWAKILTEDFLGKKERKGEKRKIDGIEGKIIDKYLTYEHINKEYLKLCEKYGEETLNPRHTFELLSNVFNEFIKDNLEIVLNKEHLPTINFKELKKLSDEKTKACQIK